MDSTDRSILVGRLERQSDQNFWAYLAKVGVVTALGYAPLVLIAFATLASCCFAVESLLSRGQPSGLSLIGCVAGPALLIAMIRSLRVPIAAPAGREISREEAPALFSAIDEVIEKMASVNRTAARNGKTRSVSLDAVTLDREFNAGICQIPRWECSATIAITWRSAYRCWQC